MSAPSAHASSRAARCSPPCACGSSGSAPSATPPPTPAAAAAPPPTASARPAPGKPATTGSMHASPLSDLPRLHPPRQTPPPPPPQLYFHRPAPTPHCHMVSTMLRTAARIAPSADAQPRSAPDNARVADAPVELAPGSVSAAAPPRLYPVAGMADGGERPCMLGGQRSCIDCMHVRHACVQW